MVAEGQKGGMVDLYQYIRGQRLVSQSLNIC